MKNSIKLIISFGVTFGLNFISQLFTKQGVNNWYIALEKSQLTPPGYIFGIVWSTLYLLMSLAVYLIWKGKKENTPLIFFYFSHLLLHVLWCYSFFSLQRIKESFIILIILLITICYLFFLFLKEKKMAAYLLLPYFLWVSFATYLSLQILLLNPIILH